MTTEDIQKAKLLLAEAGYPDGFKPTAITSAGYTKQSVFVQDQLKAIGIQVAIQIIDRPTEEKRLLSRDFDLNVLLPAQPINDPDLFLAFAITGGGRNWSGFSDKQVDEWYQEQSRMNDPGKRKEIVLNAQRRILDLAAVPILYSNLHYSPYWKCVKGYYPEKQFGNYNNNRRQDIWLAEDCR